MPIVLGLAAVFMTAAFLIRSGRLPIETVYKIGFVLFKTTLLIPFVFGVLWIKHEHFDNSAFIFILFGIILTFANAAYDSLNIYTAVKRRRLRVKHLVFLIVSLIAVAFSLYLIIIIVGTLYVFYWLLKLIGLA